MTDVLMTKTHNGYRMDLTRQAGFIVTVYDPDGLRFGATEPAKTPDEAFAAGLAMIDGKVPGPDVAVNPLRYRE